MTSNRDSRRLPQAKRKAARGRPEKHQEDLLDEALKETFPASDPVSVVRID